MLNEIIKSNKVSHGKRYYKQMSLEVAVRNPERYLLLIQIFDKYDGILLDDDGILEIYSQLYIDEFLIEENIDPKIMTKGQIKDYIKKTKKHNNEWGFPTGYQAAFTRYLKTLSEFGFIYSQYQQTFKLSQIGKALSKGEISLSDSFAIQSLKFWRKSPYRRVLNDFNYFKFIYDVLIELFKRNKKLSYAQFMISLFSDNGDVDEFLEIIENNKFGNDLTRAYDYAVKRYSLADNEHAKVGKYTTAINDYGNTVFRVLQLTGFITVEYSGIIMMSINSNRLDLLNALYNIDFTLSSEEKEIEYSYFKKLGNFPQNLKDLIAQNSQVVDYSTSEYNKKIPNIMTTYSLTKEYLGQYLLDIALDKKDRKVFWFIQAPIKLEFILTLFIYSCYGNVFEYKPNFKCDDVGIPYSHAPGNIGDIEIFNKDVYWLIEATLIRNKTQQLNNETINLVRHIDNISTREKYLELVAPFIHDDTSLLLRTANLVAMIEKKNLQFFSKATSIKDFVSITEEKSNFEIIQNYSMKTFVETKNIVEDLLSSEVDVIEGALKIRTTNIIDDSNNAEVKILEQINSGKKVYHEVYGYGIVQKISNENVEITFDKIGLKRIPIKKILLNNLL